jgi:hypothetical protein
VKMKTQVEKMRLLYSLPRFIKPDLNKKIQIFVE